MSAFNKESFYKSGKEMQNKVLIMKKSKTNPNYKVWELFTSNVSFFLSLPSSWWGRFVKAWLVQLTQTNVWWSLSRGRTLVMFLLLASSALLLSYSVIVMMINKMKLILRTIHVNPWLNNQKKRIQASCDRWIYLIHFFFFYITQTWN